ncbi:uncharacterized protein PV09_08543 [Verruconis gallopava]|uniref:Metal homeostatis protein bsd2 n=1 Tax=Verruconis gallopava TaxID=253628 RepID=A0A0D1YGF3_9PEZI|nr:uncharacterized protein PV09_08543 [Verruconis gallopava]KIV99876.1 hypothetical protein PV09_08543 [Verruconis gallopava]
MSGHYARVATTDDADHEEGHYQPSQQIPDSPPPSFHSWASSPVLRNDPLTSDADRELHDTFDSPSDDEGSDREDDAEHGRRLLVRSDTADSRSGASSRTTGGAPAVERRVTQIPVLYAGRTFGGGNSNDGVFANLSAKPTRGEEVDEKPPSYEQAAMDNAPPYWETTILAPGMVSDEVYVDGLPVGSLFSFVWNAMISMSFQVVGFLLTYLLHTTHAAKNGSLAGLGITLVQFGFSMKSAGLVTGGGGGPSAPTGDFSGAPTDPNSHDFTSDDSTAPQDGTTPADGGISTTDWFAYVLMIVGWFILIRSISDFLRARRHEQLVLQSPDRGLPVPVVAEGETPSQAV